MIKGIRRSLKGEKRSSADNGATTPTTSSPTHSSAGHSPVVMSPPKNIAKTPPKKIIRALYDYIAQGPGELRFRKGDFLYVTGYENSTEWYEAYDPPSNMLGMVPVSYFEVVSRKDSIPTIPLHTAAATAAANGGTVSNQNPSVVSSPETLVNHNTSSAHNTMSSTNTIAVNTQANSPVSITSNANFFKVAGMNSHAQLYAVVKHEFNPERADELQASVGESIIIIARSNQEWVVAKPIGRLGGPGLIPINFIEIRDIGTNKPVSDLNDALNRAHVPYVEEWKRLAAEYKASSIPLGKIDDLAVANNSGRNTPSISQQLKSMHVSGGSSPSVQQKPANAGVRNPPVSTPSEKSSNMNDYYNNSNSNISASSATTTTTNEPEPQSHVIAASVDSYAFNNERYWYLVVAKLSNGKHRNLCRFYQDFYDFQIKLLDEFPVEAGRTGQKRTLPFMPGPLTYVNDSISSQRRVNLDEYVKKLVALPDYISKGSTVQNLFKLREGDIETDGPTSELPSPTQIQENMAISGPPEQVEEPQSYRQQPQTQEPQQLEEQTQPNISTDTTTAPVQESADLDQDPTINLLSQSEAEPTETDFSVASPVISASKGTTAPGDEQAAEAQPPVAERAVKIKIFHEDDLIAVRVLNTIPLAELSAKITERLQLSSVVLLHKDEASGTFTELNSDADLQRALGNKVKLVLNAK